LSNWYQHIQWLNVYFIIGIPLIGLVGAYFVPLQTYTAIFAAIYYFNTGLGITAGMSLPPTMALDA
jgi:stearoyl-CoA desaturase (delta-9 desaturase)